MSSPRSRRENDEEWNWDNISTGGGVQRGVILSLIVLTIVCAPSAAAAQTATADPPATPDTSPPTLDATSLFHVGTSEWMVTGASAWGVRIFHSTSGHQYVMQTISWGRVLSHPRFSGKLRGRFEWAFEATPLYAQYLPNRVFGFGVAPLVWRWNFEPHGRYAPYAELGGGALWTSAPVPQRTTAANFTAHAGGGVRMLIGPQHAVVVAYRLEHISNGNRLDRNPGVNTHAIHVGLSLMRPPKARPPG
jgi:hypothetical protein